MDDRYLVVHTPSPDGIPRPHLVPSAGLSLAVGMGGLGVVTWPGGFLGVLERASDLARALSAGSRNGAMWAAAIARFVAAETAIGQHADAVRAAEPARGLPGVPGVPGMGPDPAPPDFALALPVTLPGAHGGPAGTPR